MQIWSGDPVNGYWYQELMPWDPIPQSETANAAFRLDSFAVPPSYALYEQPRLHNIGGAPASTTEWADSFVFAEAFILPLLATAAPQFVDGVLGTLARGQASEVNLGALPTIYSLGVGVPYMLGGLLFGIATFRAGILPRWPAGLLAVAAALTPLAALLPHAIQRLAGIPVGLALAWLGYALWSERRTHAAEPVPGLADPQLGHTGAE